MSDHHFYRDIAWNWKYESWEPPSGDEPIDGKKIVVEKMAPLLKVFSVLN
jgi:hypothetical protein